MDTTEQHTTTHQDTSGATAPGPDDPRWAFARAVATARQVMAAVGPDQWDLPTPCVGTDVAGLQEHLVMVIRRVACSGRGVPLQDWPVDAADVAPGGWVDAFTEAAHDVQAAWPDAALDEPRQVPWGAFSGRQVLEIYTNEVTVHTWDLATATGQSPDWDPTVLEVSWAAIRFQLPDPERGPMWEEARRYLPEGQTWEDPFADAVPVPDDSPLIDRLVAWNGRNPGT